MNKNTKFIYFDIGGVLVKDFSRSNKWEEMKSGMGITPEISDKFEQIWDQYTQERVCLDYDVDNLIPILEKQFGLDFPQNYSILQDFVDRFERNDGIWSIVNLVKEKSHIGLLTNMYPRMLVKIHEANLLDEIDWDVVIDSSEVGYQKPEKEIFEFAQSQAGVESNQILFIDNTRTHLQSASTLGWQTLHYDSCDYEESNIEIGKQFVN